MGTKIIAGVALAGTLLLTGCGGSDDARPAAETVTASDGSDSYVGPAEDAEFIRDMQTNNFWPGEDADTLIEQGHHICDKLAAGDTEAAVEAFLQAAGYSGENSIYLVVIAEGNYCQDQR